MIDYENQIYTKVATALRSNFTGIDIKGILTLTPSVFPTVCIQEADNFSDPDARDTESTDRIANVTYEINIITKSTKPKSEAKSIFAVADNAFRAMGFTRTFKADLSSTVEEFRLFGRYEAAIDEDGRIYNRR